MRRLVFNASLRTAKTMMTVATNRNSARRIDTDRWEAQSKRLGAACAPSILMEPRRSSTHNAALLLA